MKYFQRECGCTREELTTELFEQFDLHHHFKFENITEVHLSPDELQLTAFTKGGSKYSLRNIHGTFSQLLRLT